MKREHGTVIPGVGQILTLPKPLRSCLWVCPLRGAAAGAIFPTGFPQPFAISSRFSA